MSNERWSHSTETIKPELMPRTRDPYRWVVFAIVSLVYFLAYFHRMSTSVIVPDLLDAFQIDATALGFMSSMYFYAYAFEQPLVGYLTDRLGARRVISLWTFIAAIGCLIFGFAPTIGWASVGRAIIGFGVGGVYVPAVKAFSQWFEEREFSTTIGLFMALGNMGGLVATTPLVWMTQAFNWRVSFYIIAGITLFFALISFFLMRDYTQVRSPLGLPPVSEKPQLRTDSPSIASVLISYRFWVYGGVLLGIFGTYYTLQGLWATPFLMSRFGMEVTSASEINMLIPLGFIVGSPLWGWLGGRVFRNKVLLLISLLAIMSVVWVELIIYDVPLGIAGVMIAMFLAGCAAGGVSAIIWTLIRESTPASVLGLTTGLLNLLPILGVAIFQFWTGAILDRVGRVDGIYPPAAYQSAFSLCLAVTVVCLVITLITRKKLLRESRSIR